MPISQSQFLMMLNRTKVRMIPAADSGVDKESELHNGILSYCQTQGWLCVHSRMDAKTTTACGVADFIIFAKGRVFVIECKTRIGKQTTTQRGFQLLCEMNGQPYHIVRSMDDFLKVIA